MNPIRIYIAGTGILSALGTDRAETFESLKTGCSRLQLLTRFESPLPPLPAGEIEGFQPEKKTPITHQLAVFAADQAMAGCTQAPDAVVLGVTTGGLGTTESLLKEGCTDPAGYGRHAISTVAEDLARRYHCTGPVLTLSTACSSGACAIALAAAMLRTGSYKRVLTGGVDSLCRLTYYGFKSLQLIDPEGARPFARNRRGMSVAEGAGMLLLEASDEIKDAVQLLGAGLSCDAHHPTQPHPEGAGAVAAMQSALTDAGLSASDIDYINLHGTGTIDNDRAEALAVKTVFGDAPPPLSSVKGAMGHPLAAAGAIEAVIATLAVDEGLIPGNTGCIDPDFGLTPVSSPLSATVDTVLSNSFGFGGNNATLIIGRNRKNASVSQQPDRPFTVTGWAAVTGAGHTTQTLERLRKGLSCKGKLDEKILCESLPSRTVRRLGRLSQIALALSTGAEQCGKETPKAVYFGTAWGSLSETSDFLDGLFSSQEKFSSPTDFIGSVHNAPAGQIALLTHATGPNITVSGGDTSFEQALFAAQALTCSDVPILVAGADEGHEKLSPLFDPSVATDESLSDGGGCLVLQADGKGPTLRLSYYKTDDLSADDLVSQLGGPDRINETFGVILAGIPGAFRKQGEAQLARFMDLTRYPGKVIDYRLLTGEYGAASAVATVFAAALVAGDDLSPPVETGVLVLGFGKALTAIEVTSG